MELERSAHTRPATFLVQVEYHIKTRAIPLRAICKVGEWNKLNYFIDFQVRGYKYIRQLPDFMALRGSLIDSRKPVLLSE